MGTKTATTTKPEAFFAESFAGFACVGDSIEAERNGLRIVATIREDSETSPEDYNAPGCCFFVEDKQNEPGKTNQRVIDSWNRNEWQYCGLIVKIMNPEGEELASDSLWGIELNFPEEFAAEDAKQNEYLNEVAEELASEAYVEGFGLWIDSLAKASPDEAREAAEALEGFEEFFADYLLGLAFTAQRYATETSEPDSVFGRAGCDISYCVDVESEVWERFTEDQKREVFGDALAFFVEARELISEDFASAGSDFHLTRNGHGVGFWDGDWTEGDKLAELAKPYGSLELCVHGKHIEDFEEEGFEGPDACLEASFFEYGMLWKQQQNEEGEPEFKFVYPSDRDWKNDKPTRYHWGFLHADCDIVEEFDWIDWNEDLTPLGIDSPEAFEEWLSLPLPAKIFDIVNLFGAVNVFGENYCAGNPIHYDESRAFDIVN